MANTCRKAAAYLRRAYLAHLGGMIDETIDESRGHALATVLIEDGRLSAQAAALPVVTNC